MKPAIAGARAFLHAHPAYAVAAGLALTAGIQAFAGDLAGAAHTVYGALGILGVRLASAPAKG